MDNPRAEFLHRCNVENYTRQLRYSRTVTHRVMLMALLAEETASAKANGWSPLIT